MKRSIRDEGNDPEILTFEKQLRLNKPFVTNQPLKTK